MKEIARCFILSILLSAAPLVWTGKGVPPLNSYENTNTIEGWACSENFYKVEHLCVNEKDLPKSLLKDIKKAKYDLVKKSISQYYRVGNCPCPYNLDGRGYRCGARSAYSWAGGYNTYCYPEDINLNHISLLLQKEKFYKERASQRRDAWERFRLKIKGLKSK